MSVATVGILTENGPPALNAPIAALKAAPALAGNPADTNDDRLFDPSPDNALDNPEPLVKLDNALVALLANPPSALDAPAVTLLAALDTDKPVVAAAEAFFVNEVNPAIAGTFATVLANEDAWLVIALNPPGKLPTPDPAVALATALVAELTNALAPGIAPVAELNRLLAVGIDPEDASATFDEAAFCSLI